MPEINIKSGSEAETIQTGRELAETLEPGDIVCLHGDLGAGKTHFVKGVASFFGINEQEVNSPTFVIIQEYPGRIPVYHFDGYRLKSPDEAVQIGVEEYFYGDGVCVIEWPDKFGNLIPTYAVHVTLSKTGQNERMIRILKPD